MKRLLFAFCLVLYLISNAHAFDEWPHSYKHKKARIGNGPNYILIDTDGLITAHGNARVRKCVWLSADGIGANPAKTPDFVKLGTGSAWEFVDNQEREVIFNLKTCENRDKSEDILVTVGWASPTQSAACDWELTYHFTDLNEDVTDAGTTVQTYGTSSSTSNGLITTAWSIPAASVGDNAVCGHVSLLRDGNDGNDTLNASAYLMGVCVTFIIDGIGGSPQ